MAADQDFEPTSTRPYLIRALHEWCCDNGFTPYVTVFVDASVQVPLEYVENDEIVLNVGLDATTALRLGNEYLEFKARFSGSVREVIVPMDHVLAIFSRESGQGMAFPRPEVGFVKPPVAEVGVRRTVVALAKAVTAPAEASLQGQDALSQGEGAADPLESPPDSGPSVKSRPALTRIK